MAGGTLGEVTGSDREDAGPAPVWRRFARSSFTLLGVLSNEQQVSISPTSLDGRRVKPMPTRAFVPASATLKAGRRQGDDRATTLTCGRRQRR